MKKSKETRRVSIDSTIGLLEIFEGNSGWAAKTFHFDSYFDAVIVIELLFPPSKANHYLTISDPHRVKVGRNRLAKTIKYLRSK